MQFTTEHVDYPHEPGRLIDCPACESGPCQCTDYGREAPCVSVHCTHPDTEDTEDTEDSSDDYRRLLVLRFAGNTVATTGGYATVGTISDPIRSGHRVMVWTAGQWSYTDTVAQTARGYVRLLGDTEWTPRGDVVRIYSQRPQWFGIWWGGESYALPDCDTDTELFARLEDARSEFLTRYRSGRFNRWERPDGTVTRECTPAVDEACALWLYRSDPREGGEADRVLTIGPRGGTRVDIV